MVMGLDTNSEQTRLRAHLQNFKASQKERAKTRTIADGERVERLRVRVLALTVSNYFVSVNEMEIFVPAKGALGVCVPR